MTVETEFEQLRLAAISADEASLGDCRALEPSLLGMLRLVLANPELRGFFVNRFSEIAVGKIPAPPELVPFCMRELRFPEVAQAVRAHFDALYAAGEHARYMNYCSHVIKAYEDFVWEDAEMWDYYSSKELNPSIVPALVERLSVPDVDVQFNALYALEAIGPNARQAQEAVQNFLNLLPRSSNLAGRAKLALQAMQRSG